MTFGEKVKELRKANNLTINGLSKLTGLSIATISLLENGKHVPNALTIHKIARALNVDFDKLYILLKK